MAHRIGIFTIEGVSPMLSDKKDDRLLSTDDTPKQGP